MLLDGAGSVLPEGLQFFKPGWWLLHVLAFALVFVYGYRRGRMRERREQRAREKERVKG
ncbi:MAG: hypothetical protein AAB113_11280 [Candidatus Eisenbacteria bacterium]